MPTPDRTSLAQIVEAAREILESAGMAGLTMQAVADRVGVRAPSLYKRVRSRGDLIGLVAEATVADLAARLEAILTGTDPRKDLTELARAFRAFAHAHPVGYRLIFDWGPDTAKPDQASFALAAAPLLRIAADLAGPEHALEAARTITAWANGFLSMELAGAFNLGGDLDVAFEYGVARLADAFIGTRPAAIG
ncbi:TetR family transcriptional regulator [Asanoa ferruginea]|uniref:TetR family transcriptional regulator n=1 Tax=Asanoa ferruginea TaxID=53367 RepID=A0A3D9ZQ92_9ACTN|nr:TetR/AcrR family transcriptional regulator [Asanoa ferruginea]REF99431.1 TetR family transcriptional regulator [Asanoa ferruginea]GIF46036.1 TetR family transcriptional regulator [Asanoa ferruginea]